MIINSGSVTYSRVAKVDDYGVNKKAEVTLSFTIEGTEDAGATLDHVSLLAINKVRDMLAHKAVAAPATPAPKPVVAEVKQPEPVPAPKLVEKKAAEPVVITDQDLHSAATRRNGEIKNSVAIRNLIGSFAPEPNVKFTLAQIPPERRQEFLDKLDALPVATT